jgi:hypothetical protein
MGDRTITLLRLASLPPTERDGLIQRFYETGARHKVDAKIRDFARRKFLTTEDLATTQLTKLGQQQLALAETMWP